MCVTANGKLTSGGLIARALRKAQNDVNSDISQNAPMLAV